MIKFFFEKLITNQRQQIDKISKHAESFNSTTKKQQSFGKSLSSFTECISWSNNTLREVRKIAKSLEETASRVDRQSSSICNRIYECHAPLLAIWSQLVLTPIETECDRLQIALSMEILKVSNLSEESWLRIIESLQKLKKIIQRPLESNLEQLKQSAHRLLATDGADLCSRIHKMQALIYKVLEAIEALHKKSEGNQLSDQEKARIIWWVIAIVSEKDSRLGQLDSFASKLPSLTGDDYQKAKSLTTEASHLCHLISAALHPVYAFCRALDARTQGASRKRKKQGQPHSLQPQATVPQPLLSSNLACEVEEPLSPKLVSFPIATAMPRPHSSSSAEAKGGYIEDISLKTAPAIRSVAIQAQSSLEHLRLLPALTRSSRVRALQTLLEATAKILFATHQTSPLSEEDELWFATSHRLIPLYEACRRLPNLSIDIRREIQNLWSTVELLDRAHSVLHYPYSLPEGHLKEYAAIRNFINGDEQKDTGLEAQEEAVQRLLILLSNTLGTQSRPSSCVQKTTLLTTAPKTSFASCVERIHDLSNYLDSLPLHDDQQIDTRRTLRNNALRNMLHLLQEAQELEWHSDTLGAQWEATSLVRRAVREVAVALAAHYPIYQEGEHVLLRSVGSDGRSLRYLNRTEYLLELVAPYLSKTCLPSDRVLGLLKAHLGLRYPSELRSDRPIDQLLLRAQDHLKLRERLEGKLEEGWTMQDRQAGSVDQEKLDQQQKQIVGEIRSLLLDAATYILETIQKNFIPHSGDSGLLGLFR